MHVKLVVKNALSGPRPNLNWEFVFYLGWRRTERFLSELLIPHEQTTCEKAIVERRTRHPVNPGIRESPEFKLNLKLNQD